MRSAVSFALIVLIAGCASPTPAGPGVAAVAGEGLVLHGLVVDPAITPLANATIAVMETNLTAVTDGDGRFSFVFEAAGLARLAVSKAGYVAQAIDIQVAQDMDLVRIKLEGVPIPVPTYAIKEWTGIIQCSARTPQDAYAACKLADDATGLVGDDADERYEDISSPPTYVQVEMDWTSTQPLGSSLRLMLTDDHREGLDNYAVATGESPLMVSADNETLRFKHLDTQGLYIRVFTGEFQGLPLSLTVQQTFSVYTLVFQHYTPPVEWRFTDGEGVPPA